MTDHSTEGVTATEIEQLRARIAELEAAQTSQPGANQDVVDEARLSSTLIHNLPGAVYRCANDADWSMLYMSDGVEELTGYTAKQFTSGEQLWNDLLHPEEQEALWEQVQAALTQRKPFKVTYRLKRKDGQVRWMWEQGYGIFAADGNLQFLEGFITDITKQRQSRLDFEAAHQQLAQRQNELQAVLENAPVILFALDEAGVITLSNGSELSTLGLQPGEVVGQSALDMYRDYPAILESLERALKGEAFVDIGVVGDVVFETNYRPIRSENGDVMGTIGVATNVTKRAAAEQSLREAHDQLDHRVKVRTAEIESTNQRLVEEIRQRRAFEEALRRSEARLSEITDAVPGCVYQYILMPDGTQRFEFLSQGAEEMFGRPVAMLREDFSLVWDQIHEDDVDEVARSIEVASEGPTAWRHDYRIRTDAGIRWIRGSSVPEPKRSDGGVVWNGILLDITEAKLATQSLESSEARNRALLSAVPDLIFRAGPDGTIRDVHANNAGELALPPSEFLGKRITDVLPETVGSDLLDGIARCVETRKLQTIEYELEIPMGSGNQQAFEGRIAYGSDDEVLLIARNITEEKDSRQQLDDRNLLLDSILKNLPVVVYSVNAEGILQQSMGSGLERVGRIDGEMIGKDIFESYPQISDSIRDALGGETVRFIGDGITADGMYAFDNILAHDRVRGEGAVGFAIDVTDTHRATQALHQRQVRLSILHAISASAVGGEPTDAVVQTTVTLLHQHFPSYRVVYSVIDEHGQLRMLNSEQSSSMRDIRGLEIDLNLAPKYLKCLWEREVVSVADTRNDARVQPIADIIEQGGARAFLDMPLLHDARLIGLLCFDASDRHEWSEHEIATLKEVAELLAMVLQNAHEQQERLAAEAALRESELKFQQLATNVDEVFWIVDTQTMENIYVSPAFERIWGRSLSVFKDNNRAWTDSIHIEDRDRVIRNFQANVHKGRYDETYRMVRPDGEIRWIHDRGFPLEDAAGEIFRVTGIAADITRQRQAAEEKRRHQIEMAHVSRRNTMGEMATRLAHEVNQPLSVIVNYAEAWLRHARNREDPAKSAQTAERVIHQAERASRIIKRIREFLERRSPVRESVELNQILHEAIEFVQGDLDQNQVRVHFELADLPPVRIDPVQIEQVALNLALNASEAMGQSEMDIRELFIQTDKIKGFARVSFRDTGPGIHKSEIDKLFEPFYTTKAEGMGMGLSICRSIIEDHGGKLHVENHADNHKDAGAVFWFTLPC